MLRDLLFVRMQIMKLISKAVRLQTVHPKVNRFTQVTSNSIVIQEEN